MTPFHSEARVGTPTPERYITRLCKHFAHKVPAPFEGGHGRIEFPAGTCTLDAEADHLVLRADAADADGLATVQDVVARHLERFAAPGTVDVTWSSAA